MTLDQLTAFLGWCTAINFAILIVTTVALWAMRDFAARMHAGMFGMHPADIPGLYFRYLSDFKVLVLVFNLTPYLALRIL